MNGRRARTGAFVVKPTPAGHNFLQQAIFRIRSEDGTLNQAQLDEKRLHSNLDQPEGAEELRLSQSLSGNLHVAKPVWLHGPFPMITYTCKPGDVYLLQVRYPIRPGSRPVHVDTYSDAPSAVPTDVALCDGELSILTTEPQTGTGRGVGYFTILVKAFHEGSATVAVNVRTDDGSTERLRFPLHVGGSRRTLMHGVPVDADDHSAEKADQSSDSTAN